jgi:hypothetical protein
MTYFVTPPLNIIDLPADAGHTGKVRPLNQIRGIVIHSTEGTDSRAWLSKTTTRSCLTTAWPGMLALASGVTTRSTT